MSTEPCIALSKKVVHRLLFFFGFVCLGWVKRPKGAAAGVSDSPAMFYFVAYLMIFQAF
jgi:hypothetical protein